MRDGHLQGSARQGLAGEGNKLTLHPEMSGGVIEGPWAGGVRGTNWRGLEGKQEVPAREDGGRDCGGSWWGEEDL